MVNSNPWVGEWFREIVLTKLSSRVRREKRAMATQLPKTSWTQRRSEGWGEISIFASSNCWS